MYEQQQRHLKWVLIVCTYIHACIHTSFINWFILCVLGGWECPIFHFLQSWQTWTATGKWKPSDDSWMGDSNVSLKWDERCNLSSKGLVFHVVCVLRAALDFFSEEKKWLGSNCSNFFFFYHNQHLHWICQKAGKLSCWLCTDKITFPKFLHSYQQVFNQVIGTDGLEIEMKDKRFAWFPSSLWAAHNSFLSTEMFKCACS